MATRRFVKLGCYIPHEVFLKGRSGIEAYLSDRTNIFGQILLTLAAYLGQYEEKVGKIKFKRSIQENQVFTNGSLTGLVKYINRSVIDISVQTIVMDDTTREVVGFTYPFKLSQFTFVTSKPKYEPKLFGIFHTFSHSVWLALAAIFVVVALAYFAAMKRKYSPDKVLLHVFGILLRQSAILRSDTVGRKILFVCWVLGAMILCLSHDSVFLSFLSFPPLSPINNLSELAAAVEKGEYQCLAPSSETFLSFLKSSKNMDLRAIGKNLQTNSVNKGDKFKIFIQESGKQNLALIITEQDTDALAERYFIARAPILEIMPAMMVRKQFCCKELLDTFVHRMMAAGLYLKSIRDRNFLLALPSFLKYSGEDTDPRKLTLTDVAPAFLFLLAGYMLSFLVLIVEILLGRKKKVNPLKNRKSKNKVRTDVSV